jgi:(1->4)-alpha-D-glucan 1-alpha-D-glucosylmutase
MVHRNFNAAALPSATYRLQMHRGFNLAAAIQVIPYLHSLGISHVYTSSLLAAKPGSTHGYDVIDHSRLNPEIGTDNELRDFSNELKTRGMGLILDVVPNHMSIGGSNAWWQDVLKNGPSSTYAAYFDIAWNDHYRESLRGKVLLPILGTTYGEAVDGGHWRLEFADGAFVVIISEMCLPIDPRTYGQILEPVLEELKSAGEPLSGRTLELQSILAAIRHLPPRAEPDPQRQAEGHAEIAVIQRRLQDWAAWDPAGPAALVRRLEQLAADPAALDHLIEAQAYRPCYWRVASDEINYRRFFDVNDLAALATERPEVFDDVHRLIFEWLEAGIVNGLRIDHPDGLYDPRKYLDRLQERWPGDSPLYVVVEKILGLREPLPEHWAAAGTTGYEFLNAVNALFVDPAGQASLTKTFEEFTGWDMAFDEMVYRKKFLILQSSLTSELHMLAGHFDRLAQSERASRDFTLNGLRHALRELLCSFSIYRTYIDGEVREVDELAVRRAVNQARRRNPLLGRAVFDFLRDTLLLKDPPNGPASPEYRAAQIRCAGKFQQLSAPVMAKGLEDTVFYLYNRLVSLNEVGNDPKSFGRKPADLHAFFQRRAAGNLSPLATHDTKRGEDARARLNVLSEIPEEWAERVAHWRTLNEPHRVAIDDNSQAPDRNEEYLLYQTLLGTWTSADETASAEYAARIREYMTKAVQEAKVHSNWINPDPDYLSAVTVFIDRILDPKLSREFLADFCGFVRRLRPLGFLNSLAQTLIRCTAPGVPDTYQGNEFWDFHLVDPDNRQPVDFDARRRWLREIDEGHASWLKHDRLCDDRWKLFVLAKALRLRRRHFDLFAEGEYRALTALGPQADHTFAFLRSLADRACLVAVPRLMASLPVGEAAWRGTNLPLPLEWRSRAWRDVFNDRVLADCDGNLPMKELFTSLPLSLLITES